MISRTVAQIADMITVKNDVQLFADTQITGVCIDSRKIDKGNLFIPFRGAKINGHTLVEKALEMGAAACLWQEDEPNPPEGLPLLIVEDVLIALQELARAYRNELSLKVIGVTGSNGKTTTKDMLASVLSQKYVVQKTIGNFNNHIGLPLTILSLDEQTEIAVLEMGMSAKGEISFLTNLANPDIAVITNIGEAHLQDLGSRGAIAQAKLEIAEGLDQDGLFVYMGDEPLLQERIDNISSRKQSFGRGKDHTIYTESIITTQEGSEFVVNLQGHTLPTFELPILGEYNVMNALAVILVANECGLSYEQISKGLEQVKLTAMRMEMVDGPKNSKIINDAYNASPSSMQATIQLVEKLEGYSKKIVVLGDMLELGEEEVAYHQAIGAALNPERIHYVYTYGQLGKYIAESAIANYPKTHVLAFDNKPQLIDAVKEVLSGGELLLVKGSRGVALEEVVNALKTIK